MPTAYCPLTLRYSVGRLWLAEEIFAGLLANQTGMLKFEVGALNLTAINGEFLRERAGRGQDFAGGHLFILYLLADLFPHLCINRSVRIVFENNVHYVR